MSKDGRVTRRQFIQTGGAAAMGGVLFANPLFGATTKSAGRARTRVALAGTGVRGIAMYGRNLLRDYGDVVEMVGVCDQNPGRLRYGHQYIGSDCPAFTDVETMLRETQPEKLIVTTWDWEHHPVIDAGLRAGAHVIVEKPVTIDAEKSQFLLDSQRQTGGDVTVTHNYRFSPHRGKLKELLMSGVIGDIRSVDFHWNITHSHLTQYMQRWHGQRDRGGTLWVHKASHHFDLINWWLDSEPVEVFARGALEHFGRNNPFRGENCRNCAFTDQCDYHWDITRNDHLRQLYAENEGHDGYIRDNCVFRENIDIYDKHAAVVQYANGAYLNYSLTGDADYEGFWLAFNGTKGRIEGREGGRPGRADAHEWYVNVRGQSMDVIRVPFETGGHWGGDRILMDQLFRDPDGSDPLHQSAGLREGIMAVLAGVAARKSIDSGEPVRIAGLTDLEPQAVRVRG
jgi:predicted dehydrogenase